MLPVGCAAASRASSARPKWPSGSASCWTSFAGSSKWLAWPALGAAGAATVRYETVVADDVDEDVGDGAVAAVPQEHRPSSRPAASAVKTQAPACLMIPSLVPV